jgi:hypothetical protein
MSPWTFLVVGYFATIAIETPILLVGLSPRHALRTKLFAGAWLTACTYPIVVLALPNQTLIAETFAPLAEVAAFAVLTRAAGWRDAAAITVANLASFGVGLLVFG